jgi:hypothetical protein
MNKYQFDINNESSKKTNFKPDINKLSTNKKYHLLANIVIRDIRTIPEWIL